MTRRPRLSRKLLAAALIQLGATNPQRLHAQSTDSLTSRVTRALVEEGLVGATWSSLTPSGVTLGAAGLKDASRRVPMQPHDRVQVGSIAKTFIAAGVLHLVSEGRVALDVPVAQYLPDLPIENPFQRDAPLLVRHLLDHTGGLGDVRMWQVFTLRGDPDAPLATTLARPTERVRIRSRPGARFSYSNTGYLVLAMLIERVAGMRYEAWLDRELLAPLGMTHSTFAFVSQRGANADTTLAMGHFDIETPYASYAIPTRPTTQFTTTAGDMAKFAQFLMSDGVVNGRTLIHSTLLRSMAVPTTTEAVQAGLHAGYGFGLTRRERWGITGKCHLGNMGTFRAIICIYPEHRRAFFVSYNTDPEDAGFDRIDSLVATSLGVPQTASIAAATPAIDPATWDGWYAVRPNRFPQFAYLDEVGGLTRIAWDGQAVHLRPLQGTARTLHPAGGSLFRLEGRREATHVLARSVRGVPIVSDGQRTFERVPKWRPVVLWISAAAGVLALVFLLFVGGWRTVRAWRRGRLRDEPLRWATLAMVLLVLAPLLYLAQPFLAIGDPTPANVAMAILTGFLPVAVASSLVQCTRQRPITPTAMLDIMALCAALQWCLVLAFWDLLPLMLWR